MTQTDVRNETSKHHLLKSVKISFLKHIALLSDANVPVRFRAQQRTKYSSLQFTANWIAVIRCPTLSNWFENHQPQRTQVSTFTNAPFIQNSNKSTRRNLRRLWVILGRNKSSIFFRAWNSAQLVFPPVSNLISSNGFWRSDYNFRYKWNFEFPS